ncbi:MAG: hypothetical protein EAY75_14925 [Bacteroidetes bacterium]|nr:MAG: hypothetical protein EAY75_14925 [Bacteroidota bacterium]
MKKGVMGLLALVTVGMVACDKDDPAVQAPLEVKTFANLPGDTTVSFSPTGRPLGANRYTYFSLRENKIITGADTLTNKWDIAFQQFYIKVNGGTNATGGGNAAAFLANNTLEGYTVVAEADTTFKQDNGASFAINPAPGGWYSYNSSTFLALPIPGKIIVVRTADNKYAKLEITSLYKNAVLPAASASPVEKARLQFFYHFRFVVQPNGTKQF